MHKLDGYLNKLEHQMKSVDAFVNWLNLAQRCRTLSLSSKDYKIISIVSSSHGNAQLLIHP